mgnify:CR=1 FL=1
MNGLTGDEVATAKLASAARLMLQQFDVVMALEEGEANRPHIERGLGWPYPLDRVRKRVSAESLETQVQVRVCRPAGCYGMELGACVQRLAEMPLCRLAARGGGGGGHGTGRCSFRTTHRGIRAYAQTLPHS